MLLDLIALGILLLFAAFGAWRGALAAGAGVVSLVLAYAAAAVAAGRLGEEVASRLGVTSVLGPVLAGSAIFIVTYLLCGLLATVLKRWDRGRRDGAPRSFADRLGGAFFGAFRGSLIVLLLAITATWLDAARDLGVMQGLESLPDAESSRVSEAAGSLVEGVMESALSSSDSKGAPAARMMARMVARPGPSLESMQSLMEDERVRALQKDKFFWVLVENGAGERAINQSSFYRIVHDPELRQQLADLGLVSPEAARDPALFRQAMAEMLSELGPRIKGLRDDEELQRLAKDPEIISLLESGDTLALMTHPGIQKVVSRVAAGD